MDKKRECMECGKRIGFFSRRKVDGQGPFCPSCLSRQRNLAAIATIWGLANNMAKESPESSVRKLFQYGNWSKGVQFVMASSPQELDRGGVVEIAARVITFEALCCLAFAEGRKIVHKINRLTGGGSETPCWPALALKAIRTATCRLGLSASLSSAGVSTRALDSALHSVIARSHVVEGITREQARDHPGYFEYTTYPSGNIVYPPEDVGLFDCRGLSVLTFSHVRQFARQLGIGEWLFPGL